jgi:hypothetical protein
VREISKFIDLLSSQAARSLPTAYNMWLGMSNLALKGLLLAYLVGSSEAFAVVSRTTNLLGTSQYTRTGNAHRSTVMRASQSDNLMKGVASVAAGLLLATGVSMPAFAAPVPAPQVPQVQQAQQQQQSVREVKEIRYSDFVDMVQAKNIEKVTFSADGQKLKAVDTGMQRFGRAISQTVLCLASINRYICSVWQYFVA